jgi:hypothetical protein
MLQLSRMLAIPHSVGIGIIKVLNGLSIPMGSVLPPVSKRRSAARPTSRATCFHPLPSGLCPHQDPLPRSVRVHKDMVGGQRAEGRRVGRESHRQRLEPRGQRGRQQTPETRSTATRAHAHLPFLCCQGNHLAETDSRGVESVTGAATENGCDGLRVS